MRDFSPSFLLTIIPSFPRKKSPSYCLSFCFLPLPFPIIIQLIFIHLLDLRSNAHLSQGTLEQSPVNVHHSTYHHYIDEVVRVMAAYALDLKLYEERIMSILFSLYSQSLDPCQPHGRCSIK